MVTKQSRNSAGWASLTLAVSMFSGAFCVPAALAEPEGAGDLDVQVGKTVVITSSRRWCWFPTVHQFQTGEIMVTMRTFQDETNEESDVSAYCISTDGGLTWSRRYTMGAGANTDGAYASRPDGTVWHLYGYQQADAYPPGQALDFHLTLTRFSRGGMEFKQGRDVPLHMSERIHMLPVSLLRWGQPDGKVEKQSELVPWGTIIEALNGDLMAPVAYRTEDAPAYARVAIIRSTDSGRSWAQGAVVAAVEPGEKPPAGMGREGYDEPGIVRLADKRLLVTLRTGEGGFIGESWSADDGRTWTRPIFIPHKGVALRGIRRLSNGALALTTGRPGPVSVMFSLDGAGKEWSHVTPIFSGTSTCYTDFIEIEPGKLLMVYDGIPNVDTGEISPTDQKSRNVIYGTFIYVRRK